MRELIYIPLIYNHFSWPKQSQGGEAAATPAAGGGDDFDLFGSESEDDEEKERVKQERLKAYAEVSLTIAKVKFSNQIFRRKQKRYFSIVSIYAFSFHFSFFSQIYLSVTLLGYLLCKVKMPQPFGEQIAKKLPRYNIFQKKSKKPGPIAKSNIIYDVKPWDDTIDLKEIEKHVRSIATDGLVWGASKILPIAYGLNKLQICCVIEDEKVSSDWLEEQITDNEDLVQSVDVVAFNKV